MMPDKQVPRKRPYVLLPPTAIPAGEQTLAATERALNDDATISLEVRLHEAESSAQIASAATRAKARRTSTDLGSFLSLVLLSALGVVAGYHTAGQVGSDSLTWSLVGGAAGLVLGGGCLLWTRREG